MPPADAIPPKNPRYVGTTAATPGSGLTLVIKLGTSSIVNETTLFPRMSTLSLIAETVHELRRLGHRVVLVSSGAVGMGLKRLHMAARPSTLAQVQAVAAVGQGRLMALYDDLFGQFDIPVAQVLLTKDTLAERAQYLNACNTFRELLAFQTVPIVNENDTVSNSEIRFGDNDTLSAIAAGMVNADYLFLCTDVECLYTDNPRSNPDAKPVRRVDDISSLKVQVSSPGSSLGTGGMVTKLIAAELATAAGCSTVITIGNDPKRILLILQELAAHHSAPPHGGTATPFEPSVGTLFVRKPNPMVDRKWWILHGLATRGAVYVDAGAVAALRKRNSLFAAGIVQVEGVFSAQQTVRILHKVEAGGERVVEVGKGLANYGSNEIARIKGCKSYEIHLVLGYVDSDCVIHRDNIVIV
ncbi:glutamate 5-kinase [Chytriomyces sp. MP71]|nr:glutamate 5-kinase [Chytriomyces sp. MP71]